MTSVVVVPCIDVGRAELAEARRALTGQGRAGLTDDSVARALWLARAIPPALDTLGDSSLLDVSIEPDAVVEIDNDVRTSGPLSLVAWRRDDELLVEIVVLTDAQLDARAFDSARARVVLPLRRRPADDNITAEDNIVRLQRFTFGAGKS
jgi:hypothetical protein